MKSVTVPILNHEYKVVVCWGDLNHLRKTMSVELGKLALQNIRQTDIEDGRDGLPYQADYLWHLASQPDEIGDEAYRYAQHLEWQILFLGLGKEAA